MGVAVLTAGAPTQDLGRWSVVDRMTPVHVAGPIRTSPRHTSRALSPRLATKAASPSLKIRARPPVLLANRRLARSVVARSQVVDPFAVGRCRVPLPSELKNGYYI